MKRRWKAFRYRLEVLGVRFLAALIPRLPRPLAYHLGRGAGALAAALDRHGWKMSMGNLEAAFGERYSPAEREAIARESYQQFAGTMIDLFWSPRLNRENFRQLIEFQGFDEFERTVGRGNPHIFACYHYGNFELLSLGCGWVGITPHIITQEFKNSALDPIFNHLRTRSGHQIIPRDGGIVRLYKALRRGGSVAILVDLALQLHQPTVPIECFGLADVGDFCARVAGGKNRCADRAGPCAAAAGRALPDCDSSEAGDPARRQPSRGRAALLGSVRAGR